MFAPIKFPEEVPRVGTLIQIRFSNGVGEATVLSRVAEGMNVTGVGWNRFILRLSAAGAGSGFPDYLEYNLETKEWYEYFEGNRKRVLALSVVSQ